MIPSSDIDRILFNGSVDKAQLADLMSPYTANFSFINYGDFAEIHWLNTPGPIYTTYSDNCGTGQVEAVNNVSADTGGHEVIFKQPITKQELIETLSAALVDPFGAYYFDGIQNWTKELITAWWLKSEERADFIIHLYEEELNLAAFIDSSLGSKEGIPENYKSWLDFYQMGMKEYLEWYILKLTNQRTTLAGLNFDWTRKNQLDDKLKARKNSR